MKELRHEREGAVSETEPVENHGCYRLAGRDVLIRVYPDALVDDLDQVEIFDHASYDAEMI